MIKIIQDKTTKQPYISSLYVSFDYNPSIINALHECNNGIYDKKKKIWEFPVTELSNLIDKLTLIDDIDLQLLEDEPEKEIINYDLMPYKTEPFEYQKQGIEFGLNHDKWLLLDAPGLGKSLQALYIAQELKLRENIEHCLIICGINTLKFNWKKEIEKHTNLSCRILGEKVNSKGNTVIGSVKERQEQLESPLDEFFIITNIESLRDDKITKLIDSGAQNKFDLIIFDELHKAKSHQSQQGKNLLKLKSAKYKIGMTGTVLLNSPLDAYVPLKWIGIENSSYTNFRYYFCNYGGPFNNIVTGYKHIDVLKDELERCSLRRTKDLLDLPPKTVINEIVEMDEKQKLFYDNIKQGIVSQVDKVKISTANLLAMVTRLRQATACPSILTSEDILSAKVDRCCELVEEILDNDSKVVIFSTFKETCRKLAEKLKDYHPAVCTGDDNDVDIAFRIEAFQNNPQCRVMICTHQKMGTGITLTSANYAIFIDTPWTAAATEQAQDRIYRIGTKDSVFIYNLICKDTIDERVNEIVQDKSALSNYVVDDILTEDALTSLRKYIEELA